MCVQAIKAGRPGPPPFGKYIKTIFKRGIFI